MRFKLFACLVFAFSAFASPAPAQTTAPSNKLAGVDGFPITVWLQDPKNAPAYKEIGINTFVGLWDGPTEKQLAALKKAGMKVICDQNAESLKPAWKDTVVAFMHGDEPDNAQELPNKKGYGPPITPAKIQDDYKKLKAADPRPVLLNLGQGVAWDGWYGRGERTNKPQDYAEYVKGSDIASFDIYPATHDNKAVAGNLEFVGTGTARLKEWARPRPVWACIETTHIGNEKRKPTVDEVRSEVWMAIANGASGIIYFSHEFKPKFVEAGLLADKEMAAAVKKINAEVQSLAGPLLDGVEDRNVQITCSVRNGIVSLVRRWKENTYVIIVGMSSKRCDVTIEFPGMTKFVHLDGDGTTNETKKVTFKDYEPYSVTLLKLQ